MKYLLNPVRFIISITEQLFSKAGNTTKDYTEFDASPHLDIKPSLNEVLYSEPCILSLLLDILIKVWIGKTGIIANLTQEFLNWTWQTASYFSLIYLVPQYFNSEYASTSDIVLSFARVIFALRLSRFLLNGKPNINLEKHISHKS